MFWLDATSHPVEAHVKCFGAFPAHVVGEDALGGCVFSLHWSGRLWMAYFNQGCADRNILLDVEEDSTSFSLGGGYHDGADGLSLGENRAIWSGSRPDGGMGACYLR